jgi:methanogenic corrinoid protein MtbC1
MVDMNEELFANLLSRAIMQVGFEECFLKIVYPFLSKIGVLWQTGAINPAQEHFVSNLIRQKLIGGIDTLIPQKNPSPKQFLLFLPEGELHELGLLFYSYFLQKRGHKVIYLGQSVPLRDMRSASSAMNFDFLLTSVISAFSGKEFIAYLEDLSSSFPEKTIYISGREAQKLTGNIPSNMIILNRVEDLLAHLS